MGRIRSDPAVSRKQVEFLVPVNVAAEGAAELAADVETAPVGQVLGVRHDDAGNPVGRRGYWGQHNCCRRNRDTPQKHYRQHGFPLGPRPGESLIPRFRTIAK